MGRPLNKRYFGSGAGNQIRVRAKVGANAEGDGVIVSQRGSKKFKVTVGANTGDCFLVDKADGTLAANEMSMTVLTDDGVLRRVTKIAAHRVTTSAGSFAWNFDASTADGKVQIEEVEGGVAAPVITITTQPVDLTVSEAVGLGEFTVVATVTQGLTPTYQWQEDLAGTWTDMAGETAASLELTGLTVLADDGRSFRVVVSATGAADVTSDAVTLTVTA